MENNYKLHIYKGMIQYLLESTNYTMKNIAEFSNASIKNVTSIYYDDLIPPTFVSELQLAKLYLIILEININENGYPRPFTQRNIYQQTGLNTI